MAVGRRLHGHFFFVAIKTRFIGKKLHNFASHNYIDPIFFNTFN